MTVRHNQKAAWLAAAAVLLLISCIYSQTWRFDYVWDDRALFLNSPALRVYDGWQAIVAALSTPILPATTYFRPGVLLTFLLEFRVSDTHAGVSHLINVALHLINTLLVGCLARTLWKARVGDRPWVMPVAMALYGLHPALSEATSWVAGRFDLMVTLFGLLMLLSERLLTGWRRVAGVGVCFFLAALCKELAVVFPVVMVLLHACTVEAGTPWRLRLAHWLVRDRAVSVALLVAGVAYLGLRLWAMPALLHTDEALARTLSPLQHFTLVGQTLWFYVQMALWPFADLSPQHPVSPADFGALDAVVAGGAIAAAVAFVAWVLAVRSAAGLCMLAALFSLLPVLHILPLTIGGNIGHERFLTFPLALAAMPAAWLLAAPDHGFTRAYRVTLAALAAGWLALAVANLQVTVPLWRTELTLWRWGYEKHPDSTVIQYGYAAAAMRYNHHDEVRRVFAAAGGRAKLGPPMKILYGHSLVRAGRPEEGMRAMLEALDLMWQPHEKVQAVGLDISKANLPRNQNSMAWMLSYAYVGLAEGAIALRRFDEAVRHTDVALFYERSLPPALLVRSFALYGAGSWDGGDRAYAEALRLYSAQARKEVPGLLMQFLVQLCGKAPSAECSSRMKAVSAQKAGGSVRARQ